MRSGSVLRPAAQWKGTVTHMAKERLDKIIASMGRYSRREVKQLVKDGQILVDGKTAPQHK